MNEELNQNKHLLKIKDIRITPPTSNNERNEIDGMGGLLGAAGLLMIIIFIIVGVSTQVSFNCTTI